LALVGGAGLLATLVAPHPIDRLLYPFKPELAHPIMRIFGEMQPLHRFLGTAPLMTLALYAVAGLTLVTVVARFRHYRLWEVGLLAGLTMLASYAYRSVQDWLFVMLALAVPHLAVLLREAARTRRRFAVAVLLRLDRSCKRLWRSRLFRFDPLWPSAGLAALALVSLIPPLSRDMPVTESREWPTAAVHHIERLGISGRFFGPPDYGAYLTWRLGDRARCYTDTRGFFFPPHLLEDSHFIPQLGPDWRRRLDRVLDEHHTDYLLLETAGPRGALWRRLSEANVGRPLYCDAQAVLLTANQVRRGLALLDQQSAASRSDPAQGP
jgi:hypothetical protein